MSCDAKTWDSSTQEVLRTERRDPADEATRESSEIAYMLPRHQTEIDRLDVQHYALRAASILDVGSGTGQWAYDLCAQFPRAIVYGLDLVPGKTRERPANYRYVKANVLQGLPFADGSFDFVHQRLMVTALPVATWPDVVRDLLRVTRPGGWVELVEGGDGIEPRGPATKRLFELAAQLAATYELDWTGSVSNVLDQYLVGAGAH